MRRFVGILIVAAFVACAPNEVLNNPPVPPTTVRFVLDAPLCSSIFHVQLSIDKVIVTTDTFNTITAVKDTVSKAFPVEAGLHSLSANVIGGYVWPEKMVAVPAGAAYLDTLGFYCS